MNFSRTEGKSGLRFGHIVSVVVLVLLLAVTMAAAETAKITIIGPFASWDDSLQTAIDRFSDETGIQVEILSTTSWGDVTDKVVAMAAGGTPPDVIYGEDSVLPIFIHKGIMQPIDQFVARDGVDLGRYPQRVLQTLKDECLVPEGETCKPGALYSLPTALSVWGTFYNVSQFDSAGLPGISTNWDSDEFSWNDFVDSARKLTVDSDGDGTPDRYGSTPFGWAGGTNFISLWRQQLLSDDLTQFLGKKQSVVDALTKINNLRTEQGVIGGDFFAQTASIRIVQLWYLNSIREKADDSSMFNWSLGVIPKAVSRNAEAGFHQIGMAANTKYPDAAWKLVKYLAYCDGVINFTRAENRLPVLPESGKDFVERWSSRFPGSNMDVLMGTVNRVWDLRFWRLPAGNDLYKLMTQAAQKFTTGQASVQNALAEITPAANALLAKK